MVVFQKKIKYKTSSKEVVDAFISKLDTDKDVCSEYKLYSRNGEKKLLPTSGSLVNYFFMQIVCNKYDNSIIVSFVFFPVVKLLLIFCLLISPISWVVFSFFEIEVPIILKWSLIILPFVQVGIFYLSYLDKLDRMNRKFKSIIAEVSGRR